MFALSRKTKPFLALFCKIVSICIWIEAIMLQTTIEVFIFHLLCVFRERLPTFVWRWTGLAAPATVVPDLVAVARAGHAATRHAAARGHRATPHAVHAPVPVLVPVPALRFLFTMAAVPLEAGEEADTICIQFNVISWIMWCCTLLVCLCTFFFLHKVWVSFSLSLFLFLITLLIRCSNTLLPLLYSLLNAFLYIDNFLSYDFLVSLCRVLRNKIGWEERKQFIIR